MENRDLQGSWGGATVRQDYAMMMMMMMMMRTNRHTDADERFTPATVVGVSNDTTMTGNIL